jgi:MarR family transcriptional repressor of emrRAB
LVDRLVKAGWLERRSGKGGRAVSLVLTPDGSEMEREMLGERGGAIAALLDPLDDAERQQLEELLEKMLDSRARFRRDPRFVCRLCERRICVPCPVSRGALGKDDPLGQ